MRAIRPLFLAVALAMGCQMPTPPATPTKPTATRRPAAVRSAAPTAEGGALAGTPAPALAPTRRLGTAELAQAVTLVGKVKLISDKGLGLISNNGGGLVSNNGGGLISDKGLGYRTLAGAEESLLTDAVVEVLDAEGQVLQGPDGQPLRAVSDGQGHYRLETRLPKENLVLRVRLFPGEGQGGELLAMAAIAQDAPGQLTIDLDTASSLSAAYVLDRFVKGSRSVYDKLPRTEAEALKSTMEAAREKLTGTPSYQRQDQVSAAQTLRTQAPQLDQKLEDIKILLIGQENLGNGLKATQVALTGPIAAFKDARGRLIIAESLVGRLRQVGADGVIGAFSTSGEFNAIHDAIPAGDDVLVADRFAYKIFKVAPDGRATTVAGNGGDGTGQLLSGDPLAASLSWLYQLSRAQDGALYFAQNDPSVHLLGADGQLRSIEGPPGASGLKGVAVAPDGSMAALDSKGQDLFAVKPAGQPWRVVGKGLGFDYRSRVVPHPAGGWLYSESEAHRVQWYKPDGTTVTVAGTGVAGSSGDGGPASAAQLSYPAGLWFSPEGALYIADFGNGLVRVVENGQIRTIAGTTGAAQQGDVESIALNGPWGLTLDPQERLVIAEGGTGNIKRLEGGQLTIIAGTSKGYSGDGGPATSAQLESTTSLAYVGTDLYVLCQQDPRVRRIDAAGTISTALASMPKGWLTAIAVGPGGKAVIADAELNVLRRLDGPDAAPVIAGSQSSAGDTGDGGPAKDALFDFPFGLAYGPGGDLFVSDAGNGVVRKIAPDGTITTVAGMRRAEAIAKGTSYVPGQEDGGPAREAVLLGPGAICFDEAGNMYVAEVGTLNLRLSGVNPAKIDGLPVVAPRIRKIAPDGTITTLAGPGGKLFKEAADAMGLPSGLLIDRQGRLIVSDAIKNQLRIVPKGQY